VFGSALLLNNGSSRDDDVPAKYLNEDKQSPMKEDANARQRPSTRKPN
jgi:hypothetical protein